MVAVDCWIGGISDAIGGSGGDVCIGGSCVGGECASFVAGGSNG